MTARSAKHRPMLTAEQIERARRLSEVHPRGVVAEILGVRPTTVLHAEKRGWKSARPARRPVPSDWGIVAPGAGMIDLSRHYHASQTTVTRWLREKPVARPYNGGKTWQPPANFAALLEAHPASHVATMLGVNQATIKRARERLGIHPRQIAARRSIGWAERHAAEVRGAQPTGML